MTGLGRVRTTIEAHWIDVPKHELLRLLDSKFNLDSGSKTSLAPQLNRASRLRFFLRWMSDKLVDKSKILLCPPQKGFVI
jgi:hypothetical protein